MLQPEQTFGPFIIRSFIGKGGMGEVYRALDTRLDREVALKLINEERAGSDDYRKLLMEEAKAVARIDSPHVVKIWEYGDIDGHLFIALELIDGPDLRHAGEVMTFEQKLAVVEQLFTGIGAAHKVGLLHRDLKPANIKITKDGQLKILDFGLARQVVDPALQLAIDSTASVGDGNKFAGTLCYAAPEQLSGEPLTFCSDIFSAGVVLYELFTGTRPFDGPYPAATIYAILNEEPTSPRDLCEDIPVWLDQVILRTIAKRPPDRFQKADDVLLSLAQPRLQPEAAAVGRIRPRQTVTVIDLRNLSGDPAWDYFSEGFTEEVIREIGRRTNLVVTAQPSRMYSRDIKEMIEKCRTDFLIIGSLMKWQQQIRMNLSVYRSRDIAMISGETYESESEQLFTMLSNAAREMASVLATETGFSAIEVTDPLQMDIGAYEYYLKGRTYYQTNKPEDLQFAEMMYHRALEIDPCCAFAHAGLSDLYTFQYMFYYDRTAEKIALAKQEAGKALEISPQLAEGYRSLGRYYQVLEDYPNAESNLRKAIDCNPKYHLAHRAMAWLKEVQGEHEEAMRWAKKALELAPMDLETLMLIGLLYMDTRKYTAALSTLQRAIELAPDYGRAYHELATVYLKIGAFDEALKSYQAACRFTGDPNSHIQAGYLFLIKGNPKEAREHFETSIRLGFFPFVASYFLGFLEKLQGNPEAATKHFEESIRLGASYGAEDESNPHVTAFKALALAGSGRSDDAIRLLNSLETTGHLDGEVQYVVARAYASAGDMASARRHCDLALQAHAGPTEVELRVDPHFADCR